MARLETPLSALMVADFGVEAPGAWQGLPPDVWAGIVRGFLAPLCNGIAFDPVEEVSELEKFDIFSGGAPPKLLYRLDVELRRTLPERVFRRKRTCLVFGFDENVGELVLARPLDVWSVSNPGTPADEILFFRGERLLLAADTVDHVIAVYDLSDKDLAQLLAIDRRIERYLRPEKIEASTSRVK